MRKFLLSILFFVFACANAWGANAETDQYKWVESTYTLTIKASGYDNGVMSDYATDGQPWSAIKSSVQHIIVQDGIKTIGNYAFYNCTSAADIELPASLRTVKQGAFGLCTVLKEVRFRGSPNEWASIDFQSNDSYRRSQPFYANVNKAGGTPGTASRKFAFYYTSGDAPSSVNLEFTSAISVIKPYAFYGATNIVDVYIPGTVSTIGDYALYCAITNLYVNKKKAPQKGTNSISWKTSSTYLYVPEGATTSYKAQPFYNATSGTSTGAKNIGTSGDYANFKASGISGTGNTYKISGSFDNIEWSLDSVGTLKLEGYGSVSTNYTGNSYSNATNLPWGRFRRLVNKAIIKANGGDITALYSVLRYHYALDTIIFEQNTIPTHSALIAGTTSNFDALFDQRKNVTLKIKAASLADASANNLAAEPWRNEKLDIQLSDNLVIGDNNANNSTVLENCSTYVEAPITLQLGRTLTNTQYNTICLPFALDNEQLEAVFGAGYDLEEFVSSSLEDDLLSLTFNKVTTGLVAGKPYLLQPTVDVEDPVFEGVTIGAVSPADQTSDTYISFHGTYAPTELTGGNKNLLFLGAGNELFYPSTTANIYGFRAYFEVKGDAKKNGIRARIVKKEDMATGFETVSGEGLPVTGKKILRNGQLFIMRDGKEYNVMGIMMK